MRDSMIFYVSFHKAIKDLPAEDYKACVNAIMEYAMCDGSAEPDINGIAKAIFIMAKPQIDANNERFTNGKKGGRPKKEETNGYENDDNSKTIGFENENHRLLNTETIGFDENIEKTIGFETKNHRLSNQKPNVNDNENDNDNDNDNDNPNDKDNVLGFSNKKLELRFESNPDFDELKKQRLEEIEKLRGIK